MVYLRYRFIEQKKPTTYQYQALSAKAEVQPFAVKLEYWVIERYQGCDPEQQGDPEQHGQHQSDLRCLFLVFRRQAIGSNGDENNIVDPEYDLQECKCQETQPDLRGSQVGHGDEELVHHIKKCLYVKIVKT